MSCPSFFFNLHHPTCYLHHPTFFKPTHTLKKNCLLQNGGPEYTYGTLFYFENGSGCGPKASQSVAEISTRILVPLLTGVIIHLRFLRWADRFHGSNLIQASDVAEWGTEGRIAPIVQVSYLRPRFCFCTCSWFQWHFGGAYMHLPS